MAITKRTLHDQTEIVGKWKAIQVRNVILIEEDGKEISSTYHRHVLHSSRCLYDPDSEKFTHTDTDISGELQEVQDICAVVWTDELKAAYKVQLEKDQGTDGPPE